MTFPSVRPPDGDTVVTAERLAASRALRWLDTAMLETLVPFAEFTALPSSSTLARESQQADSFFVIEHGRVAIELHAPGRGPHLIATVGPGELIGWSWRFPPQSWHFDVIALDPVHLLRFDAVGVLRAAKADAELDRALTEAVARTMARRLEAARLQLLDLYGGRP